MNTTYLSYCIKTIFHNSIRSAYPLFTRAASLVDRLKKSTCISVQGPQGPDIPISQKLSCISNGRILHSGRPSLNQISLHSRSGAMFKSLLPPKYVTYRYSLGIPYTFVKRFQAYEQASSYIKV